MKKILSLFLFLFSLVIVGCKKEPSYIEFKTTNIVMEYDSNYTVEYKTFGKVKDISFKVEDETIVTFENDVLTSHSSGETTLICTYNKEEKIEIGVKVLLEGQIAFEVGDTTLNEENYKKLDKKIDDFDKLINSSNYLSLTMNVEINDQKISETIRAINDPIYMELTSGNQKSILAQEGNKIFEYNIVNRTVNRRFLGYANEYEHDNDINSDESIETSSFDKEKCNVVIDGNTYIITCLYKDLINEDSKKMIEEMFQGSYLPLSTLYETVVTIQYVFYEEKVYMSVSLFYVHEDLYGLTKLDITISYDISVAKFTPIDIFDGSFTISSPRCIEEVYETHDLGDSVNLDAHAITYLKVELDKGMLFSKTTGVFLDLYNMEGELVGSPVSSETCYSYTPIQSLVDVKEKGEYYVAVSNSTHYDYDVTTLDFESYDTLFNKDGIDISSINSYEGVIEGKYDLEKFIYYNNDLDKKTLRIENVQESPVYVFSFDRFGSSKMTEIPANNKKGITLDSGYNEFYICHNFMSKESLERYEYKVNFSYIDLVFEGEVYEENVPKYINLEGFEKVYYYSQLEPGLYSILEINGVSWHYSVTIYDKEGKKLDANIFKYGGYLDEYSCHFVIENSDCYYVNITSHTSGKKNLEFTKYDYKTIIDKNNPNKLDISGEALNKGELEGVHDFEYYTFENTTDNIRIFKLVNETDKVLNIAMKKYRTDEVMSQYILGNGTLYFAADPGITELTVLLQISSSLEQNLSYCFSVVELENHNISDKNSSDLVELTEEFTEYYYMAGFCLEDPYFKINIKKRGKLSFETKGYDSSFNWTGQFLLEDKYGNNISYYNEINPGEYYVRFTSNDHILSCVKIKYSIK